jgi:hypothetical protein
MAVIKVADKHDIPSMIALMKNYAKQSPIKALALEQNEEYVSGIFTNVVYGNGRAWISYRDGKPAGMLVCMKNGNFWNPQMLALNELCWWVEPEYRNTLIGYRLLHAYQEYAISQMDEGKVKYWTISKMTNSPDIDYGRLGAKPLEHTFFAE